MKKLMLLGGTRYLLPVIEKAHALGVYVITCDYIPSNIAHKYSDEYINVSIVDKEAVLTVAKEKHIDGIMSFGTDPGVVVAAYVAEKLQLPSSPYKSVQILQNKDKFRQFLKEHNFNCPFFYSFDNKDEALQVGNSIEYPVIVKPVDSAGSKGVSKVANYTYLSEAIDCAMANSISGKFIIEQFLEQKGCSSDSDCFSIDNKLVFCSFDDQYFDKNASNPYTPAAYSWPSTMDEEKQAELYSELQRLIKLLDMGTSIYNVETRVAKNGKAYIMEVSPRGGGNRLSEMLEIATGQDLISNNIRFALGMKVDNLENPKYKGHLAEVILHSDKTGIFNGLTLDIDFQKNNIKEKNLWINKGDFVEAFSGANKTIGTLILDFSTNDELKKSLSNIHKLIGINVN